MSRRRIPIGVAFVAFLALAAIARVAGAAGLAPGPHDMLATAGAQADHVGQLWNLFVAVCGAVTAAIFIAVGLALGRSPRATRDTPADVSMLERHERGPYRAVLFGVAGAIILLLALLVASVATDRALARLPLESALQVEVTGHQWWWEIRYPGEPESDTFSTANELHVPVGRPVVVTLKSDDVIHSLWVPNLSGKKDLIPGRTATLAFRADRAGAYRGQCAEFCGFQHAFMAFDVIADPPERFAAWAAGQRAEAVEPAAELARRGKAVFLGSTCVMCHAVAGTDAGARAGPELTHVGTRRTLAAGTLPNTDEAMKRWVRNPQQVKPGVGMPPSALAEADLDALVAYLRSLQ